MKRKLAIVVVLLTCKFQSVFAAEHLTKAVASCEGGYATTILDTGGDENSIQYFVVKDGVPVAQGMGLSAQHNRTVRGLQVTNISIPPIRAINTTENNRNVMSYTYIIEYPVTETQKKLYEQTASLLVNYNVTSLGKDEKLYKCTQTISKSS
ncbi:hypothetical protein ACMYSO_26040 (plasmid) [Klebsiella sp. B345]|uniref:hypothetical protein n=1 Tax=Klebsiella sp. B345 TaxID=2755398 RepID=UPI003DA80846